MTLKCAVQLLISGYLQDLTPLIYTPVVGEACLRWSEIYKVPEGKFCVFTISSTC